MEFKTGKVKWQHACVGAAGLCYADGMLYVRGQGGSGFGKETQPEVALVEATPDGYQEKGASSSPDTASGPRGRTRWSPTGGCISGTARCCCVTTSRGASKEPPPAGCGRQPAGVASWYDTRSPP